MKSIITFSIAFLIATSLFAQSPEKMSYQAVIRDSKGVVLKNTLVSIKISIYKGSVFGALVYSETQTSKSDSNGLVSFEIGAGAIISGSFTSIKWVDGPYYIKTETDTAGGINYTITVISEILSVPYALHAKTVESVTSTITEKDPHVPKGNAIGEIQYWNGTAWVVLSPGNNGDVLSLSGGVPKWKNTSNSIVVPNVTNPITGRTWMDRNLGATKVATSSTDAAAYGDLYQWGRGTDGHEKRTSIAVWTLSTSNTPGHGNFIANSSYPSDWRNPQNSTLWQGVNGTNNPCPSGYRIPTEAEWSAERQTWSSSNANGAFNSLLKLPLGGCRNNGDFFSVIGSYGFYWTSTIGTLDSRYLELNTSMASIYNKYRANGLSVRCIKD